MKKKVDLSVTISGLRLKNPVLTAAGTFGYGEEYAPYLNLNTLGAIITKGISLTPAPGNPPPRICETPAGMLNAIGLQNCGLNAFIAEKLPFLRTLSTTLIVNFWGRTQREYQEMAKRLSDLPDIGGLEMNISCPNIKQGGISFGSTAKDAFAVVSAVRKIASLPLMVKLSPNVGDIGAIAESVEEAGADAISLINTLYGMAIDVETRRPRLGNVIGGLSGPAIKPVAVRMVFEVARRVKIPVVGVGGIASAEDALEFLIAGARAVQVGTANFIQPDVTAKIVSGIEEYLIRHKMNTVDQITGSIELP
ncbi:MAG TPA: dihydroorotate dehydrogenase [Thermodesulfobacteriota bacterium]|nr:dihydroorotate dehydrogenase [Thermodesulfobacteriota bacterium]